MKNKGDPFGDSHTSKFRDSGASVFRVLHFLMRSLKKTGSSFS